MSPQCRPTNVDTVTSDLLSEVSHLDERIKQYDTHVRSMARDCALAQRLMQLKGVGETTSTALVAMVVSVRRTRLENGDAVGDDGVHQGFRWTPWSTPSAAVGAVTMTR